MTHAPKDQLSLFSILRRWHVVCDRLLETPLISSSAKFGSDQDKTDEFNVVYVISRHFNVEQEVSFGILQFVDINLDSVGDLLENNLEQFDGILQQKRTSVRTEIMPFILTINGGSSSIKFALYQAGEPLEQRFNGKIDRIGQKGTILAVTESTGNQHERLLLASSDFNSSVNALLDWLEEQDEFTSVVGVGHRVVHGMQHTQPKLITQELLDDLHLISPYSPEHLPGEIELIKAFFQRHPKLPQVACFDTAFHRTMPRVAKLLPIPRRYSSQGVERYGFHGLSYAYLIEELARLGDPAAAKGRVILAHLGNGASLAAVRDGKSIDTSMGFTPTAGLPMSTRSGDLDPGLVGYLSHTEEMTATQFHDMVNHESGLLGVSETSSDMRDLLVRETGDVRAAEAVALFCYQTRKWIGSFAAALGGLDTLVFAAGIGENVPPVRSRICEGLNFLGMALNESRNAVNAGVISTDDSRVTVRVIRTDEEQMIARSVCRILGVGFVPTGGEP